MLSATEGIVLNSIKYGENSLITTIYTKNTGRQSFIINAIRHKKKACRQGILQPLFLVELVAYHKDSRDIQRIKEIKNYPVYQNIPFDVYRSAQALFIAEILYKTLREQESSPLLFDFIKNSLLFFDLTENSTANFHLYFLFHLTEYLGFMPNINKTKSEGWFDMQKGSVELSEPNHPYFIEKDSTTLFCSLDSLRLQDLSQLKISRNLRNSLTTKLIEYYQLHFEHLGEIKSLKILNEIFS